MVAAVTQQQIDRSKLTFSQAEGIDPLPQPVALGKLPDSARNLLWTAIYEELKKSSAITSLDIFEKYLVVTKPWRDVLYDYHTVFLTKPGDEFSDNFADNVTAIKRSVLNDKYNKVFDFLQYVMRHNSAPPNFGRFVANILQHCMCAYVVVDDGRTIVPMSLSEQGDSIKEAFKVLASGPFEGSRAHLRESAKCINEGDHAGSIRESIHAVESVARRLDQDATKTLTPALEALSKKGVVLHPAFKSGIEKLYGYSSDQRGIRHSLSGDNANVDLEDSVFMFGACASFSAYLVNKARKAGLSIEK